MSLVIKKRVKKRWTKTSFPTWRGQVRLDTPPTIVDEVRVHHQGDRTPQSPQGRPRPRCLHTDDPGRQLPVESLPCGLCKTGQEFDHPTNHDPTGPNLLSQNEWYMCYNMITEDIKNKLFEDTCRGRQWVNDGDLYTHSKVEESLS